MEEKMIHVEVVQGNIESRVPLQQFKEMLLSEIGSVTFTLTAAQFKAKVDQAIDKTIQRIRDEKGATL